MEDRKVKERWIINFQITTKHFNKARMLVEWGAERFRARKSREYR